jgi:hypothetical protein
MADLLFPIDRAVRFPKKYVRKDPRPQPLPARIEFRASAADRAVLEAFALATG